MKRILLILLFCFLSFILFSTLFYYLEFTHSPKIQSILYQPSTIDTKKLFYLIQDWRIKNNLQPYIESSFACHLADTRIQEIQTDFSHKKFYWHLPSVGPYSLGENLIMGPTNESVILQKWLNSPEHKENLLVNYSYSCLRCLDTRCVQIFSSL